MVCDVLVPRKEVPHDHTYEAVPHLWITTAPDESADLTRHLCGTSSYGILAPGSITLTYHHGPARVTVGNAHTVQHTYIRMHIIEDVASTLRKAMGASVTFASPLYCDHLARALSAHLLASYTTHRDVMQPRTSLGRFPAAKQANLVSYINENIARDMSIKELACVTHCSPSHLSRTFKATFNCSPYQYLMALRMERAKTLLTSSQLAVVEVGAACGLPNPAHFTASLRRNVASRFQEHGDKLRATQRIIDPHMKSMTRT